MGPGVRFRVAAYLLLAVLCGLFAGILASSEKYGTTAAVFQAVLSVIWLVAAVVTWKFG